MGTFNYMNGIKEDVLNMIGEVGSSITVRVPTKVLDAWGNLTSITWTTYTESIWVRRLSEVVSIEAIGEMNREDIRVVAPYSTHLVVESEIDYDGETFTLLSLDRPNESGTTTHFVGYGKRKIN